MAKTKVEARELKYPDVEYLSLVKRGANRVPFRIMKRQQETDMSIDLGSVFKGKAKKAASDKVELQAIAVVKRDDMEPIRTALKAAGFSVDSEVERDDGTVMYAQVEKMDEAQCWVFKASEEVAAFMKGGTTLKSDEGALKELFDGFVPSAAIAAEGVMKSAIDEMANVTPENVEAYKTMLKNDFEALAEHIVKAMTIIPEALLTLELPEPTSAKKGDDKDGDGAGDEGADAGSQAKKGDEGGDAGTGDGADKSGDGDGAGDGAGQQAKKEDEGTDKSGFLTAVKSMVSDMANALKEDMQGLVNKVDALSGEVKATKAAHESLTQKLDEVETATKSVSEALGMEVISAGDRGDEDAKTHTRIKSDDADPRSGQFDTAFLPRRGRH